MLGLQSSVNVDDSTAEEWVRNELSALVGIPSPSGSEAAIIRHLETRAGELGLPVRRVPTPGGIDNLVLGGGDPRARGRGARRHRRAAVGRRLRRRGRGPRAARARLRGRQGRGRRVPARARAAGGRRRRPRRAAGRRRPRGRRGEGRHRIDGARRGAAPRLRDRARGHAAAARDRRVRIGQRLVRRRRPREPRRVSGGRRERRARGRAAACGARRARARPSAPACRRDRRRAVRDHRRLGSVCRAGDLSHPLRRAPRARRERRGGDGRARAHRLRARRAARARRRRLGGIRDARDEPAARAAVGRDRARDGRSGRPCGMPCWTDAHSFVDIAARRARLRPRRSARRPPARRAHRPARGRPGRPHPRRAARARSLARLAGPARTPAPAEA